MCKFCDVPQCHDHRTHRHDYVDRSGRQGKPCTSCFELRVPVGAIYRKDVCQHPGCASTNWVQQCKFCGVPQCHDHRTHRHKFENRYGVRAKPCKHCVDTKEPTREIFPVGLGAILGGVGRAHRHAAQELEQTAIALKIGVERAGQDMSVMSRHAVSAIEDVRNLGKNGERVIREAAPHIERVIREAAPHIERVIREAAPHIEGAVAKIPRATRQLLIMAIAFGIAFVSLIAICAGFGLTMLWLS